MGAYQSTESVRTDVQLITRWHLDLKETLIFDSGLSEITQYLEAVDKILQSASNDQLKDFIYMAITRLKHEFQTILTRQTEYAMGSTSITELSSFFSDTTSYQFRFEDFLLYDAPKRDVANYLRSIAERLGSCGEVKDLTEVYIRVRRSFVDSIVKNLKLDALQAGDIKKFLREELKMKTERWIQAAKVCLKLLFPREKQMAEQILGGLGHSVAEESFMHIVKDSVVSLFSFAETVISSHQSQERLEIILILYKALSSLVPDLNALFEFESANGIRNSIAAILSGIQDEVRRMLTEFETIVLREASTIVNDSVAVHHLTEYVVKYLNLLLNHRELLMSVIVSKPSITIGSLEFPEGEIEDSSRLSPLGLHIILIIAVLQLNLEMKGKSYKNPLSGYLFRMNNIQFVVQKIKGSNYLQEMVGPEYLKKLTKNVKEARDHFLALSCENLLHCLKEDDLYVSRCSFRRVSRSALRKQMKNFNSLLDNMHAVQPLGITLGLSMREELYNSTIELLVPAYRSFLEKFRNYLKLGNDRKQSILSFQKIAIKYSVDDLRNLVSSGYQLTPSSSH